VTIGRQINFFALPADHAELEDKLRAAGPFLCVCERSSTRAPEVHPSTAVPAGEPSWSWFLVRPQDRRSLVTCKIPDFGHWVIDYASDALVIELCRSRLREHALTRGRLYFRPRIMVDGDWQPKPADFVAWGDKVLRIARRFFRREAGEYVGPHTLAWLRSTPGAALRQF
jgi:hypothetical protein